MYERKDFPLSWSSDRMTPAQTAWLGQDIRWRFARFILWLFGYGYLVRMTATLEGGPGYILCTSFPVREVTQSSTVQPV